MLWMDNQLVDLITLELLLSDGEKVVCVDVTLPHIDVPNTYVTSRVPDEEPSISVEHHAIGMHIVEDA